MSGAGVLRVRGGDGGGPARWGAQALADACPAVFWLDRPDAPEPRPALAGTAEADLVVVGGGFTGLWTALQAKEADPGRDVVLLEAETIAFGASGRNGGFVSSSLTHGLENGAARWPDEIDAIERLAAANFAGLRETIVRHGIEADFRESGLFTVATDPRQLSSLAAYRDLAARHGRRVELLDRERMRAEVHSPTYYGGVRADDGEALVDPARLAWGLARAAASLGVRIHERTAVRGLEAAGAGVRVRCASGEVRARRVVLATSAFPPLLRRIRAYVVPVYDYVLVTEPLDAAQREAVGWRGRQGIADAGNQFHYYRLTADDRILWGGYDAVYWFGGDMGPHRDQRDATHRKLAEHFFATFPQLEGVRFTHRWGGAIDTCSRFSVMFGAALRGRVAYAVGFTGLGVGASRFAAQVALDLVDGRDTERTRLKLVRSKPVPFPPEPLRYAVISLTRAELARADRNGGRRGLWLRVLDRLGLGFAS